MIITDTSNGTKGLLSISKFGGKPGKSNRSWSYELLIEWKFESYELLKHEDNM